LRGTVAGVSPHIDDAVLSRGATIAACTSRRLADVRVVTVFAGDVDSTAPAGPWDAGTGFATAGEAARARREEDVEACAHVGAATLHLPFVDGQYRHHDDRVPVEEVVDAVAGCDVVVLPGAPLRHPDHLLLHDALQQALDGSIALYEEQPYARHHPTDADGWLWRRASGRDVVAKLRAVRAYRSQVPRLGGRRMLAGLAADAARPGERLRPARVSA
jgi:LmbE family N-acetylglucosaminyl deacetylase